MARQKGRKQTSKEFLCSRLERKRFTSRLAHHQECTAYRHPGRDRRVVPDGEGAAGQCGGEDERAEKAGGGGIKEGTEVWACAKMGSSKGNKATGSVDEDVEPIVSIQSGSI